MDSDLIERIQALMKMRVPFPANQISTLPKRTRDGGVVRLSYVGHAALTNRLLDVDPLWTWEPLALDERGLPAFDEDGGLWIKLIVCGRPMLGYGHAYDKTGGDAIKECIGDAIRNAAMRMGGALDLWHKGDLHATDDDGEAASKPVQAPKMAPAQVADWLSSIQAAAQDELDGIVKAALEAATVAKDRDAYRKFRDAGKARK